MMTYTEAVAHITYALGNRTDIATYAGRWLNWAYLDVWEYCDAHTKEDISTGNCTINQSYISIPAGTYQILRVIVDNTPMEKREWREYTEIETFADAKPSKYYIFEDRIYFDTEPDDDYAYEIFRIKDPTALTGTGTLDLPIYYEMPLITRALAYGYRDLQMAEEANNYFAVSTQQLQSLKQQHWKENEDAERGLRLATRRRTR